MKAAFAYWENRIAPVFDVARQIHIVEAEAERIVSETEEIHLDDLPLQKAIRLAGLGVGTLVCGAISRSLREMVAAYGIQVVPFVAGDLRKVIQAWLKDGLKGDDFTMPGCYGRRHRRGMAALSQEDSSLNGRRRGGMGSGDGQGQGRIRQSRGRMDGSLARGVGGVCVCPKCGHHEPHERGTPCVQRLCPKCGTTMARE
ncbi:MAG: NifB/NifX family molybdenum-iron cluster-binding protein [Acidobacteriota bacterium]|nr:NifB/NifX family molybdenum-iron cluster-binding protein [Acidobacteriota bacterium]